MDIAQKANKLGKFIKKSIDSAYKIEFNPNSVDVYMYVYYQVPGEIDTFDKMDILINIAAYSDKLRINVIELDNMEKTVLHSTLKADDPVDYTELKIKIYNSIIKALSKEYKDYDFIY